MPTTRTALFLVLGLLAAAAPAARAASIQEWGQAFASLSLRGAGADAAGKKLTFGHLELTLGSGRLVPVAAGGQVIGAFFAGSGSFRYVSTDPIEGHTYRENVKRATPYQVDPAGGFGDAVEAALVLVSSGAEALAGAEAAEGEVPAALAAGFAAHVKRWRNDRGFSYAEAFPQAMVEPPSEPLVALELQAAKQDLLYVRDTLRHMDEDLMRMVESESSLPLFKDRRYPELLSEQAIGRGRLEPRPVRFRLVDVDATVVNRDGLRAEVEVRETVEARAPVRTLEFDLWTERAGQAGATGKAAEHPYRLSRTEDAAGNPLPFWHHRDGLTVELPRPLAAGERLELRFALEGDVLFNPGNDSYWHLGGAWLPKPPRWELQAYTYHAVVKVKKPWIAFSCGRTERRWEEGELNCAEFRETKPIQEAVVLGGKYTTYTQEEKSLTVRVSAYAFDKKDAMKKVAGLVHGFVKFYEPLLGEHPWSELNVVEINDVGWGQAPAGIIFITKEAFVPAALDEEANVYKRGINARLAHEVAHAWWGHVSMLSSPEHQWLSEATADYYAGFAMGTLKGKGEFEDALREWTRYAKEASSKGSVVMANYLAGNDVGFDRIKLLYGKGPLVLHALRQELGDDPFFTVLKSYLRSFPMKPAYTKDLIGLTSFIAKKDMQPFFDRYLLGTEVPGGK